MEGREDFFSYIFMAMEQGVGFLGSFFGLGYGGVVCDPTMRGV